ncbi:hypothetical protein O0I10_006685 [Lichtheimia ornata]|uniref:Reverse transcriptase RNase H-like domain-containing protein n=1 Tax=Lichtheimia ornata TaxID=688661 RepID=A0AAD7XX09_9FUNG|nr:uncharacterized protein O0I10_006685 [Lichtheimia ornata]KAJ8657620.1 hypothetical protein O0I10_006685 [Lichtheimia ornata]
MLAIIHALRTWRCFIDGRPYTVFSDHNPLTYFRAQKKPTCALRWIGEIELRDGPACHTDEQHPWSLNTCMLLNRYKTRIGQGLRRSRSMAGFSQDLLHENKDKFIVKDNQVYRLILNGDQIEERRFVLLLVELILLPIFTTRWDMLPKQR